MTNAEIEAFLTICEYGSISKAAEKLFISQSSLSTKIKTLENPKLLKSEFENCTCIQDFLDAGLLEDELTDNIKKIKYDKKLTAKEKLLYDVIEDMFNIDESQ